MGMVEATRGGDLLECTDRHKFRLLTDFIVSYLRALDGAMDVNARDQNDFTSRLLFLTSHLVSFGFVGDRESFFEFSPVCYNLYL